MTIDVIRLAREAGMFTHKEVQPEIKRFAALVMEECAKVASDYGPSRPIMSKNPSSQIVGRWEGEQAASSGIAAAIRARKPA